MTPGASTARSDQPADSWVVRRAPGSLRPYLLLARADRPIGTWLLLWPGWWSIALAAGARGEGWPDPLLIVLFGVGAWLLRAAGCTLNDVADRDYDGRVARTRSRPIPSGAVSVTQALAFMVGLGLAGLAILLTFNRFAIGVGLASAVLIAVYPFMKRVTYWPQAVLGLAFNWGALLGWAAVSGALGAAPIALYLGGIAWTLGYDTIYAHQDKADDRAIGVKSLALKLGAETRPWLAGFYALAVAGFALAGWFAGLGAVFYAGLALAALHLAWQVKRIDIDDPADCLAKFKSNRDFGFILMVAIVAGSLTA
jgi:4-hydroxybenzoate polyprenyltransferase